MPNLIDFLETLGRDARLRYATSSELELALARADIEPALRAALLGEDRRILESLLGAQANVCCVIHAPDEDEETPEDDDPGDGEDDGDEKEDDESRSHRSALRRVATAP